MFVRNLPSRVANCASNTRPSAAMKAAARQKRQSRDEADELRASTFLASVRATLGEPRCLPHAQIIDAMKAAGGSAQIIDHSRRRETVKQFRIDYLNGN